MRPIELAKMQNVNLKDDMWQDLFNIVRDLDANAIRNFVVSIGSLLIGLVASVMGEHLFLFNWLFTFVVADYLTGLYAAKVTHTLSSRVGLKGILRKFVILFTAIGFHGIDQILSMPFIGAWAIGALSVNELISILENVEKAGLGSVIPSRFRVLLDSVQQQQNKKVKEKLGVNEPNIKGENPK